MALTVPELSLQPTCRSAATAKEPLRREVTPSKAHHSQSMHVVVTWVDTILLPHLNEERSRQSMRFICRSAGTARAALTNHWISGAALLPCGHTFHEARFSQQHATHLPFCRYSMCSRAIPKTDAFMRRIKAKHARKYGLGRYNSPAILQAQHMLWSRTHQYASARLP